MTSLAHQRNNQLPAFDQGAQGRRKGLIATETAIKFLSIEQGAVFDGRSRRVKDPSEIAPQLERSTAPDRPPGVPPAVPTHLRGMDG